MAELVSIMRTCKVNCKCGKAGTALNCEVISVSVVLPRRPIFLTG